MTQTRDPLYRRHRFPAEVISYTVWLYFRFPLSLRMVEELLAARGIVVSRETIRQWSGKFGREFSNGIRRRAPARGDKWHLDEEFCRKVFVEDATGPFRGFRLCGEDRELFS